MITVKVTEDDIKSGEPYNHRMCPIAIAVKRATGGRRVSITRQDIVVGDFPTSIRYPTPIEAYSFILGFDMRIPVKPFTFILD